MKCFQVFPPWQTWLFIFPFPLNQPLCIVSVRFHGKLNNQLEWTFSDIGIDLQCFLDIPCKLFTEGDIKHNKKAGDNNLWGSLFPIFSKRNDFREIT